jgi:hypothetical protein
VRRVDGLIDDRAPRKSPGHDRGEIERNRDRDPFPLHRPKRIGDGVEARPAPPEKRKDARHEDERHTNANGVRTREANRSELHAAARTSIDS